MDISKISANTASSVVNEAKIKAGQDDFEKRLQSAYSQQDDKELKKVCKEFEGVMLSLMYKQMKATVPKSDLIEQSEGMDIYESMLDEKLMDTVSESGGIGLGDKLYEQISKRLKATYRVDE